MGDSIRATNGITDVMIGSQELPAPSFGQRSEAIQVVATFEIPELGEKEQFTDEWAIQIARAVVLMRWSSDVNFDPVELEVYQILGTRFAREMALRYES